ncbi:MAG: hypothetical protein VX000_12545, partial [Myxococcota bacterium]|nr:hypothetical protein [Myxococcota bacterium]
PVVIGAVSCTDGSRDALAHRAAFPDLHARVITAQASGLTDGPLHDHLAGALVGQALTNAFLAEAAAARRRTLAGASVEVESFEHETLEVMSHTPGSTRIRATWLVVGRVQHGDHAHRRATRYAGRYRVVDTPLGPRIAEERAEDAVRLPAAPRRASRSTTPALDLLEQVP